MTISDKYRKHFEGIGLDAIKRELTVGNNFYIPIDPAAQAEAKEWVAEQEEKSQAAERSRTARETKVVGYTFWTLVAAIAAVVVGIVGIVLPLVMH